MQFHDHTDYFFPAKIVDNGGSKKQRGMTWNAAN